MTAAKVWKCGEFDIDLTQPKIMGIVNVTPDSFSDGGLWATHERAVEHAMQLKEEGVDILDIGGESTRPGSEAVPLEVELERVIPVVEALKDCGLPISVDTTKPAVMRAAVRAGAVIINDINGLREPGAREAVAETDCGVCIMHMQGQPRTMQKAPHYDDLMGEVLGFLTDEAHALEALGVAKERICIDPGFGFGKTVSQNFELLARTEEFVATGYPVLYGMSRKSSLGAVTGLSDPKDRVIPSVVAHLLAAERGAQILRVHDVAATIQGIRIWQSTEHYKEI